MELSHILHSSPQLMYPKQIPYPLQHPNLSYTQYYSWSKYPQNSQYSPSPQYFPYSWYPHYPLDSPYSLAVPILMGMMDIMILNFLPTIIMKLYILSLWNFTYSYCETLHPLIVKFYILSLRNFTSSHHETLHTWAKWNITEFPAYTRICCITPRSWISTRIATIILSFAQSVFWEGWRVLITMAETVTASPF